MVKPINTPWDMSYKEKITTASRNVMMRHCASLPELVRLAERADIRTLD
jgi:hypothetical protein